MTPLAARTPIAAAALAAALAGAPPAAAAPALAPLKACYDAVAARDPETGEPVTEPVTVAGSGFTPGALVDVAVDGVAVAGGVPVDAAGVLAPGTVDAPWVARGQRRFTVTVTEQADPSRSASATALVTRLIARVRPRSAAPRRRVRFSGRGFTARRPVYAHYVRRGRARRTVRLVRRPTGACGTFSVRRRQFPFRPARGRWTVQLDQQRGYRARPDTAFVRVRIRVTRRG